MTIRGKPGRPKTRRDANLQERRKQKNRAGKFGGMRRNKADKKIRSALILALGSKEKRAFSQKHPRVKVYFITVKEIFDFLESEFVKPANITFKRYKLMSRKQKNRESYFGEYLELRTNNRNWNKHRVRMDKRCIHL